MIIVDLETSGTNPEKCSILSLGAVDFDHPERQIYLECRMREEAVWDEAAARIHGFSKENSSQKELSEEQLVRRFLAWLGPIEDKTLAGQCIHFDYAFLQSSFHRYHLAWIFGYRLVDLHSVAYVLFAGRNQRIPLHENTSSITLDAILSLCGLARRQGHHNALQDALLEAECLSRLVHGKALLDEFKAVPVPVSLSVKDLS